MFTIKFDTININMQTLISLKIILLIFTRRVLILILLALIFYKKSNPPSEWPGRQNTNHIVIH